MVGKEGKEEPEVDSLTRTAALSSGLTERRMKIKIILLVEKDNVIRQVFIYKDYRLHQMTGLTGLEQKENR